MSRSDDLRRLQDRVGADDIDELQARVTHLEKSVASLERRLKTAERTAAEQTARTRRELRTAIDGKRIDRQLKSALAPVADAVRRAKRRQPHVLILCPSYPDGSGSYGGQFVRARVRRYLDYGVSASVLVINPRRRADLRHDRLDGIDVWRGSKGALREVMRRANPDVIGIHHPEPTLWSIASALPERTPFIVWVHGYEARSWRELEFNHADSTPAQRRRLDALDVERRSTIASVFERSHTDVVFVSDFMRGVAEEFAGGSPRRGHTIPNLVDPADFAYVPKRAEDRHRVLWVRSFERFNYANDIARDALLELSNESVFERFEFTIVGDGALFDEVVGPLRHFPNVSVSRGFVEHEELAALHRRHGVILAPSRWDSQGLTSQEAMSSGLVPITTKIAAIPEFISTKAGYLCEPEDPSALAAALRQIDDGPERYLQMSAEASASIQRACGPGATVALEADLITAARPLVPVPRRR